MFYVSLFILTVFFVLMFISLSWPIYEWDALTLYDIRGMLFAQNLKFIDLKNLDQLDLFNPGYYFSYPPSTSIIHAVYYVYLSRSPQIIYPVFYLLLVMSFYTAISRYVNKTLSNIFSLIFSVASTFVSHSMVPYTNLIFTYFYFTSTIYLLRYISSKQKSYIFISAILLASSSWVRFVEPFYISNIIALIGFELLVNREILLRKIKNITTFIFPVIAVRFLWSYIQKQYTVSSFLNDINYFEVLPKLFDSLNNVLPLALNSLGKFFMNNFLIFLILIITSILFFIIKKFIEIEHYALLFIIFANIGLIIAGTIAIGVILPNRTEIYDSIQRFGMFLYPLILLLSCSTYHYVFKNKTNEKNT